MDREVQQRDEGDLRREQVLVDVGAEVEVAEQLVDARTGPVSRSSGVRSSRRISWRWPSTCSRTASRRANAAAELGRVGDEALLAERGERRGVAVRGPPALRDLVDAEADARGLGLAVARRSAGRRLDRPGERDRRCRRRRGDTEQHKAREASHKNGAKRHGDLRPRVIPSQAAAGRAGYHPAAVLTIKRTRRAAAVLACLAGCATAGSCVGPAIAPEEGAIARGVTARVAAMESPPLGVPLEFRGLVPGGAATVASPLLVYNSIAVLIELPAAARRAAEDSKSLQTTLDAGATWAPSAVAAQEAGAQLAASGFAVRADADVWPVPGLRDRGRTVLMENWLAPIRAWYDTTPTACRDAVPTVGASFRLEVGILNYEIVGDRLLLQVMMRVVDCSSGAVVGRSRAAVEPGSMPRVAPIAESFAGDAAAFKEIVSAQCRPLGSHLPRSPRPRAMTAGAAGTRLVKYCALCGSGVRDVLG